MNIIYCRQHAPNKKVISANNCTLPTSHEEAGVEHTDTGIVTVDDDPKGENETSDQYLARLETTYQAQFV